jgi:hypothetical protein
MGKEAEIDTRLGFLLKELRQTRGKKKGHTRVDIEN